MIPKFSIISISNQPANATERNNTIKMKLFNNLNNTSPNATSISDKSGIKHSIRTITITNQVPPKTSLISRPPSGRPTLLCDNQNTLFPTQNPVSHKFPNCYNGRNAEIVKALAVRLEAKTSLLTASKPRYTQVRDGQTKYLVIFTRTGTGTGGSLVLETGTGTGHTSS
ncbi:hypothetical protein LXL04_017065 [Taraxacum kok-saghyz]